MKYKLKEKTAQIRETFRTSKRLTLILWRYDKLLFLGLLASTSTQAIIPFINAYIYKLVIDLIIAGTNGNFDTIFLYILIGARFTTLLASEISLSVQTYMDSIMWTKIPLFLYSIILTKLTSLDVEYFENDKFRDMLQRVKEGYAWRPLNMYSNIFYTFQSTLVLIIAFFALATLNIVLALGIILAALPALLHQIYFTKTRWGVWSENSPYRKKFWYLSELIQDRFGIKEIKIFETAGKFLRDLSFIQKKFAGENLRIAKRMLASSVVLDLLGTIVYITIELFIIMLTVSGRITLGTLSYFTAVIFGFQNGVYGFFRNAGQLFEHNLYVRDIINVLDIEATIKTPSKAVKIANDKPPSIEFRNVSFAYPGTKKKVLDKFNLIIKPGDKIAFVGENGAGKTTIIKLLARFYDVTDGEILINNTNIKEIDLSSLYRAFGVLFQDFIKYEYTLGENIHFGKVFEKFNLQKIEIAAKESGANNLASSFNKKYNQMLGLTFEGGIDLSAGQWQKVALARAFLRDAPVLILDEPTASIDAASETEIFDKVERLGRDKTVFIISHRFSTVKNADLIYVIKHGKIIESGNHADLIGKKGVYARLFNLQAERYK